MKPTRLFDLLENQLLSFPQKVCVAYKYNGTWKKFSTSDVNSIVNHLSLGLLSCGITKGDKVGIISANRPEWNFVDLALQQIGAISVPMYPNSTEKDYAYICRHSELKMVFVSDQKLAHSVKRALTSENLNEIHVYSFDKTENTQHWEDLIKSGKNETVSRLHEMKAEVKPEDLFTIIYTSGTTGTPKGVMLTHDNVMSIIRSTSDSFDIVNESWTALSFLPLCHIFARAVFFVDLFRGVSVYYAESMDTISDNLKEVKPNYFATVPRLLEKVYDKILAKGYELSGAKKQIFFWAIRVGNSYQPGKKMSAFYNWQLKWARKLVFSKWKEALGGNLSCIISGASALQPRLVRIFGAAEILLCEGYGLTETSPTISIAKPYEERIRPGYAGELIDCVEVKIADDGEILTRGPNVMMGYFKEPELTAEVITKDGWFHTGDIGELTDDGYLKITDRKKELFKTSGGKYIAPQPLENKFKESILIDQIMVVGNNRKYPAALIVPFFGGLREWCLLHDIPYTSDAEMIRHPEVKIKFDEEVGRLNENFARFEQIKNYTLLSVPWSIETDELTPTLKLKRRVVTENFTDVIELMYAE